MYISLFKSEIGSKLRPRSMFQPPLFAYRYGHSFILFIIGCISAEIVGTLNFFLFIQIREIGREKVIAAFAQLSASTEQCVLGMHFAFFNCSRLIVFQSYRQCHASCMMLRQKRKWMRSELIRLDRNSKHSRLLNVKSIHRYRTRFFHHPHSDGRYSFSTFRSQTHALSFCLETSCILIDFNDDFCCCSGGMF